MLTILKRCTEENLEFPEEVREAAADAFARLVEGHKLSLPLSRPMPAVGPGCHELRLRHRSGAYRIIYRLAGGGEIEVVHAFKKKTQATPSRNMDVARKRLKGGRA